MGEVASPNRRIIQLDALRGLAVIGIVWMNVYVFALPLQAYYNPIVWGNESALDQLIWTVSFVFVEDKFRTLFAVLFGAGFLILFEQSNTLGNGRPLRAHFARMLVLFAIGLFHSILFASNDVLRVYALAGLVLPFLSRLSVPSLIAVAIGLVAVHVGGGIVATGAGVLDFYNGRMASDIYLAAERQFGSDAGALEYSLALGSEELSTRIERRTFGVPGQLVVLLAVLPLNLAAMVLGMSLWRSGMLSARWRTYRLQRLAAACAVIALPMLFALTVWMFRSDFAGAIVGASALVLSAPFDTLLGVAYAALAMAFFVAEGPFTRRLAAVGRLSLTNYLMTSFILAAIFAGWGLGLFGSVSRFEAFVAAFVPIIGMLIWSPIWQGKLGRGPFERLWRSASRLLA